MKMPSRKDYTDAGEFLAAIDHWSGASDAAYQHLKEMYDAAPECSSKPDWIEQASDIMNVSMTAEGFDNSPDGLVPCLRNLSGAVLNKGMKIVRVCHGKFQEDGMNLWVCFAECVPL